MALVPGLRLCCCVFVVYGQFFLHTVYPNYIGEMRCGRPRAPWCEGRWAFVPWLPGRAWAVEANGLLLGPRRRFLLRGSTPRPAPVAGSHRQG